jgi:UDP-N-acetylmuramate dehydrogenase
MGKIERNFPLAQCTSWKIGGFAKVFYEPQNLEDLINFLQKLPKKEPLVWLGAGSNVLIADEGINATVICTKKLTKLNLLDETSLRIEAGATCAQLISHCLKFGLTGAEFLAGIPGTIGGALTMNAGAFDQQIWDLVTSVETINRSGKITTRLLKDFVINYRHTICPLNEWFISANIQLAQGEASEIKQQIKKIITDRHTKQPVTEPSCGSVFLNPPNYSAARLIDVCGLKGKRIGDAQVSLKHANFIINKGNAKASDVQKLIKLIQHEVKTQFGIELIPEVHFLG